MSISAILMWLLMMLGIGTPVCDDVPAGSMSLTSDCPVDTRAHAQPQPQHRFTGDISNGI